MKRFQTLFDDSISSDNTLLTMAIAHIRQKQGKMMRPILMLLVSKLFGGPTEATYRAAVSLELLHTASLIHDDVVDESTQRRGQLSVNALFNNKVAVLVGDFLFASCLEQAGNTRNNRIIEVVSRLGQDLSEGELLQLDNVSNLDFSELVYFEIIRKKTAALFSACTRATAFSCECTDEQVQFVHLIGEYIGLCFQIKDDVFDYFDEAEIGKPTGNDMLEGKLTLPVLYLLNHFPSEESQVIAHKVKKGTATADEIAFLVSLTKQYGGIDYALGVMEEYRQKALDLLAALPRTDVRVALETYIDYVVSRNK